LDAIQKGIISIKFKTTVIAFHNNEKVKVLWNFGRMTMKKKLSLNEWDCRRSHPLL